MFSDRTHFDEISFDIRFFRRMVFGMKYLVTDFVEKKFVEAGIHNLNNLMYTNKVGFVEMKLVEVTTYHSYILIYYLLR